MAVVQLCNSEVMKLIIGSSSYWPISASREGLQLADRSLSPRPSIGQICRFERGYECMRTFGEGL